jgi:hypothetical protein
MQIKLRLLFIALLIGLIASCTENPFFKEEIKFNEQQTISGQVDLEFSSNNSGIIVYLESLDKITRTDSQGNFTLKIQSPHNQPGNGLTGLYKIHYYVANYKIETSTVLIVNGEFVFDIADLNSDGQIRHKMVLKKLLDVTTAVNPSLINHRYSGNINVVLTLINLVDTVIVSSRLIKKTDLGSVYLSSSNQVHLIESENAQDEEFVVDNFTTLNMTIDWDSEKENIAEGNYDVIPYLQVIQPGVPEKLLDFIGVNSQNFDLDFLKMPYRRNIEQIVVSE